MSTRLLLVVLVLAALAATLLAPRGRREVPAPSSPRRIVSLVPSATEILFDIGLGDRVVGVTTYCLWPAEARTRAIVGGFADPNLERILALNPDLVVEAESHPKAMEMLRASGLPLCTVRILSLADALDQYDRLGKATGEPSAAAAARRRLEDGLRAEEARWTGAPRVRVALVVGREAGKAEAIYVAGPKSFVSELAALVGGDNVFGDLEREFATVSAEAFLRRAPDVILELNSVQPPTDAEARAVWARLGEIPAVTSGRVRVLSQDYLLAPGARIPLALRSLAEGLR
ncbi:MAG: ABC transporter substrate-binding protein [Candidatus Brocadiae bacterium]|nr:ABC transporter substrate-binding protein [Candidatus Brocadiia bacterium]